MSLIQLINHKIFPVVGRNISPLRFMSPVDYYATMRNKPLVPGETRVLGLPTRYSDKNGLFHSLGELFGDEVYRFKAATDTPRIIDAGANIGLSVRYFKSIYPNARILAYEPDPQIFEILKENVGGMPGVEIREAAAWVENTKLTFYVEGSLAGSSEIDFLGKKEALQVAAERLRDEVVKEPVDFLKIDIEGAENSVLFDIEDALENVENLFFEYYSTPGKDQQLGDLLNIVARSGFRYTINGPHGAAHPFVETVPHGFDLQLNVSCYRNRQ